MKHVENNFESPLLGFVSTILMIFVEVITVSGVLSTIFYAALGVATGWVMQYVRKRINKSPVVRKPPDRN